jgi:hypothetical protein
VVFFVLKRSQACLCELIETKKQVAKPLVFEGVEAPPHFGMPEQSDGNP